MIPSFMWPVLQPETRLDLLSVELSFKLMIHRLQIKCNWDHIVLKITLCVRADQEKIIKMANTLR